MMCCAGYPLLRHLPGIGGATVPAATEADSRRDSSIAAPAVRQPTPASLLSRKLPGSRRRRFPSRARTVPGSPP